MQLSKLKLRQPPLTRELLVNPYRASFAERLRNAQAVDLTDNHQIILLKGGYDRVIITDPTRIVK